MELGLQLISALSIYWVTLDMLLAQWASISPSVKWGSWEAVHCVLGIKNNKSCLQILQCRVWLAVSVQQPVSIISNTLSIITTIIFLMLLFLSYQFLKKAYDSDHLLCKNFYVDWLFFNKHLSCTWVDKGKSMNKFSWGLVPMFRPTVTSAHMYFSCSQHLSVSSVVPKYHKLVA